MYLLSQGKFVAATSKVWATFFFYPSLPLTFSWSPKLSYLALGLHFNFFCITMMNLLCPRNLAILSCRCCKCRKKKERWGGRWGVKKKSCFLVTKAVTKGVWLKMCWRFFSLSLSESTEVFLMNNIIFSPSLFPFAVIIFLYFQIQPEGMQWKDIFINVNANYHPLATHAGVS